MGESTSKTDTGEDEFRGFLFGMHAQRQRDEELASGAGEQPKEHA